MPTSFVITESDINQGLDLMLRERSRSSFIISEHDIDLEMDLLLLEQGKVKKIGPGRIEKAIETGDPKTTSKLLDNSQAVLDVIGVATLFPPIAIIGEAATVLSFILNTARGKYAWALFDLFAMIPIAGGLAKASKLGKTAKAASTAAKWKSGRTMIKVLGSAKNARKAITVAKAAKTTATVTKATESGVGLIVELIPKDLMGQVIEAEIPGMLVNFVPEDLKDETFVGFMLEISKNIPMIGDKIPEVQKVWEEVKKTYYEGGFTGLSGGEISGEEGELPDPSKKPGIRIHDWEPTEGMVLISRGFKYSGKLPSVEWQKKFPEVARKYIDMYVQYRVANAILNTDRQAINEENGEETDEFYEKYVQLSPEEMRNFVFTLNKFFEGLTSGEDLAGQGGDRGIERTSKKLFENMANKLKEIKKQLDRDPELAAKLGKISEEYEKKLNDQFAKEDMAFSTEGELGVESDLLDDLAAAGSLEEFKKIYEEVTEDAREESMWDEIMERLDDGAMPEDVAELVSGFAKSEEQRKDIEERFIELIEKREGGSETISEGKLVDVVIDFKEIRSKQLDESFLAMFGGWVEWLLGQMFDTGSIPGKIHGTKREIESFAAAMGSEKRYMETAKRYGLDHPTTYKSKSRLDNASKSFEKETGIKWPFK